MANLKDADCGNSGGVFMLTENPLDKFTLRWVIENISKLPNNYNSPKFHPVPGRDIEWYATIKMEDGFCVKITAGIKQHEDQHVVEHDSSICGKDGQVYLKNVQTWVYTRYNNYCSIIELAKDNDLWDDFSQLSTFLSLPDDTLIVQCNMQISANRKNVTFLSYDMASSKNFKELAADFETMLENQVHSDVALCVGTDMLKVHKCVLCARSPVFARMFEHEMKEAKDNSVQINDVEFPILKHFVHYLYTGKISDLPWDVVYALYSLADKYDVPSLHKICTQKLISTLNLETVWKVFALADTHKDDGLLEIAKTFICNHLSRLSSDNWQSVVDKNVEIVEKMFCSLPSKEL